MSQHIQQMFRQMGARADLMSVSGVRPTRKQRRFGFVQTDGSFTRPLELDIRRDASGPYFYIRHRKDIRMEVVDVQPRDRHLLVQATEARTWRQDVSQFLCGHDERSWFVAAI